MKPIKINRTLSSQIVEAVHEVTGCPINFINRNGIIIASTDASRIDTFHEAGYSAILKGHRVIVEDENDYEGAKIGINHPIIMDQVPIAAIGITGNPDEVAKYVFLATKVTEIFIREQRLNQVNENQKQHMKYVVHSLIYNEVEDVTSMEHMLLELRMRTDQEYAVMIVKLNRRYHLSNINMIEREIQTLLDQLEVKLYTYLYPNEYIGFLSAASYETSRNIIKQFGEKYREILYLGIGTPYKIFATSNSYENAKIALSTTSSLLVNYQYFEDLKLEMILGSVDDKVKEQYVKKILGVLGEKDYELLQRYFMNNMNLKQTALDLYLHVNTLQYKLDKIADKTLLNPRVFKDAVILYTALQIFYLKKAMGEHHI